MLQNFEAETLPLLPNAASGPAGEETGTAVAVAREGTATTSNDSLWRENISGASSAAGERLLSGTCLAIAELLRLGAVQQQQLPRALRFLCRGVLYAGRVSSSSSASGACVRDAACYGAWAFARSYSAASADLHLRRCLGRHLLLALLFDDSISIRRAAAAAFQEIEGRQGQLQQGLSIITIADYFTVGSRRSSFLTAAPAIAALEPQLMDHQQQQQQKEQPLSIVLLEYLCCRVYRHPDPQMRQLAAAAAARIIPFAKPYAASVCLSFRGQRRLAAAAAAGRCRKAACSAPSSSAFANGMDFYFHLFPCVVPPMDFCCRCCCRCSSRGCSSRAPFLKSCTVPTCCSPPLWKYWQQHRVLLLPMQQQLLRGVQQQPNLWQALLQS